MPIPPSTHAPELSPTESLLGYSFDDWTQRLTRDGLRPGLTRDLWKFLHREDKPLQERFDSLPPPLQKWWKQEVGTVPMQLEPEVVECIESDDGQTIKLLIQFRDTQIIETVIMKYQGRHSLCLSSQAGCAMGCGFCATGQMGFSRHLHAGEIVAQVALAKRELTARGEAAPRNLVFMGMGEPLDNYDAVMKALDILCDDRGHGFGPSRVTVSTVGVIPGIERMAEEQQPYRLAVSLHAADDDERTKLVRANRRWPLKDLIAACHAYQRDTSRRILFGWTLIAGQNDHTEQALAIAELLRGLDAHVNLIQLNPTKGFSGERPDETQARTFQQTLRDEGLSCTLRQFRGIDVAAGCGQLKAARAKRIRPPTA